MYPTAENNDGVNLIGDWSFESGVPNSDWTPSSSFGGLAGFPIYQTPVTNTGVWGVWIGGHVFHILVALIKYGVEGNGRLAGLAITEN